MSKAQIAIVLGLLAITQLAIVSAKSTFVDDDAHFLANASFEEICQKL